jgi:hypothetical protein
LYGSGKVVAIKLGFGIVGCDDCFPLFFRKKTMARSRRVKRRPFPSARVKAEITKALRPVLEEHFGHGDPDFLPIEAMEAALRLVLGAVTLKDVSDELDTAQGSPSEEPIVLARGELTDHDMAGLLFAWIIERNQETIAELVCHGDSTGELYVLLISEEGKNEQGNMDVVFTSGPLASGEKHFLTGPEATAESRAWWAEFEAKLADHPDYIPVLMWSETYQMSLLRGLARPEGRDHGIDGQQDFSDG